jgi:hypothetical protein
MKFLRKYNSKKGISSVEAVIILPILVMITFGGLKYGVLFIRAQQITNVARQACRLAIRPQSTDAIVDAEILRLMAGIGLENDYDTPEFLDEGGNAVSVNGVETGEPLTLRITLPTDRVIGCRCPIISLQK